MTGETPSRTPRSRPVRGVTAWSSGHMPVRRCVRPSYRRILWGGATACFPCYSGDFDCLVSAPGFYSEILRYIHFKIRGDSVGYARLLEHEADGWRSGRSASLPLCVGTFPVREGRAPARRAAETGLYGGKIQGRNNEKHSVESEVGTQFLHSGSVSRCP